MKCLLRGTNLVLGFIFKRLTQATLPNAPVCGTLVLVVVVRSDKLQLSHQIIPCSFRYSKSQFLNLYTKFHHNYSRGIAITETHHYILLSILQTDDHRPCRENKKSEKLGAGKVMVINDNTVVKGTTIQATP
jgi:hypothetical protein